MAWQFEKVFATSLPVLDGDGNEVSVDNPKQIAFDGKYVWITATDRVYVYEFWGDSSDNEPTFESEDAVYGYSDNPKLKRIAIIDVPLGSHWIVKGRNSMFITEAAQFGVISEFDIATRTFVRSITCPPVYGPETCLGSAIDPKQMNSNLCYEANKLWMVSKFDEEEYQSLYSYDLTSNTWDSTTIPTKRQKARAWISAPLNGSVYVTNFNNVSISKFDAATGDFQTSIRTNAFPTLMCTNSNRELFVSSYAGMLTVVNTTNDTMANSFSTLDPTKALIAPVTESTFWFVNSNGRFGTIKRSNKSVYFSGPKVDTDNDGDVDDQDNNIPDDWKIDLSNLPSGETDVDDWGNKFLTGGDQMMITPQFTYQHFNGSTWDTITVKPYVFIIGAQKVMCFRLDRPIYQYAFTEITGQAMVSQGDDNYIGDIG